MCFLARVHAHSLTLCLSVFISLCLAVLSVCLCLSLLPSLPLGAGILGYEERPLVSTDYVNEDRSGVVDAPSTMVVGGNMV